MHESDQHEKSGAYMSDLIGNIRTSLAGLHGYDLMALELIQNADDANAETIDFDITNEGLWVRNSGVFTYCGDLSNDLCGFQTKKIYSCDYHRIVLVGSGEKRLQDENIGRFGIGFISTYQVTDHPEIRSAGIKLTLFPESRTWKTKSCDTPGGTTFFLPWAKNENSALRVALGASPITEELINQLADDFQRVLRQSLLFLRHVRKAEVRRDGELLMSCDLDRSDGSNLKVSFHPSGEVEHWHILRADAAEAAQDLASRYTTLKKLNFLSTKVGIGLPVKPGLLPKKDEGLLYAFLPTEQSSGLPLHINADFFSEPNRKVVIFAGHQHEQKWNEMLMKAAAKEIAHNLEALLKVLGHVQLWKILDGAHKLLSRRGVHGQSEWHEEFWRYLHAKAPEAKIVPVQDGSVRQPREVFVFFPRHPLTDDQAQGVQIFYGVIPPNLPISICCCCFDSEKYMFRVPERA